MVLNGEFDDTIRNCDANKIKVGKSGLLFKEEWTENSQTVNWVEGPAGKYCIVSGRTLNMRIANALAISTEVYQYYQSSDLGKVLFTEMSTFTAEQQKIRTSINGWIQNLTPSKQQRVPYHIYESQQGKVIVMATHRCAPRLAMFLELYTYILGDLTFMSTYAIDPQMLWTTLPQVDNTIKYMKEAQTDTLETTFVSKGKLQSIKIAGVSVTPVGLSGLMISQKKTLQAVSWVEAQQYYQLVKMYDGHTENLNPMDFFRDLIKNALQSRYGKVPMGI